MVTNKLNMKALTSYERIKRMYEHREADRVPVTDGPWAATLERWHREGLPADVSYVDYFDLDKSTGIGLDNTPRYDVRVIEENAEYTVTTTAWGTTQRNWKHAGGVPEFLNFTVVDPDAWRKTKECITPTRDRIDWKRLKDCYPQWRKDGVWVAVGFSFGFDLTHSFVVGTERVLAALVEQPEWMVDMFNHQLDVDIALCEMVLAEGYQLDAMGWCDDMGYKGRPFFSVDMYRSLLKPVHKRAVDWAHSKGIKVHLHSCGDIRLLVPDLIEIGIDMLNPIEVKAGMDPLALKREYGDRLAFHGGINAVLFDRPDELWPEMKRVIPAMKRGGGYWISSDHSVPQSVSLETFREFVRLAKELGSYG